MSLLETIIPYLSMFVKRGAYNVGNNKEVRGEIADAKDAAEYDPD